jgi:uncharacterized protein (DUF885 family)
MILRRDLLAGAAAFGLAPALARAADALTPEDVKLDTLLTQQFNEGIDQNPEGASALGLDKGARAPLRWKLTNRSPERIAKERADALRHRKALQAIDRSRLSPASALSYDVAEYRLSTAAEIAERFHYGTGGGRASPYIVTQLSGAYASVPEFLTTYHRIETRDDADAYLARLKAFATVLDQEVEVIRHDQGLGVTPPDFILAKAIGNLETLRRTPPAESALVTTLSKKVAARDILGNYSKAAAEIVAGPVAAALDRQIAMLKSLQAGASHDAGVWRLPDGAAFYEAGLVSNTTVKITGDEVHALGLQQVAELQARLEPLLNAQGLTQGTVGARIAALNADPRYIFPNTDAGKQEVLAYLNQLIAQMKPRLPTVFNVLPKAALDIERVPAFAENGAPLGYYTGAPLDNSRPAVYHINLRDTADWPKWSLPTLSYHEGVPGHHFQISVSREHGTLPIYRRTVGFPGYNEGWGLYAEQLADEIGAYEADPLGRIGFLQSLLFRAVRLVVDSGVHAKRWSREQAIRYMMDACGRTEGAATNEVERYCVWPGQACSYKLGHTVITRLRDEAKAKRGGRFDIKTFHDAVLLNGSLPLPVLEKVVGAWTAKG